MRAPALNERLSPQSSSTGQSDLCSGTAAWALGMGASDLSSATCLMSSRWFARRRLSMISLSWYACSSALRSRRSSRMFCLSSLSLRSSSVGDDRELHETRGRSILAVSLACVEAGDARAGNSMRRGHARSGARRLLPRLQHHRCELRGMSALPLAGRRRLLGVRGSSRQARQRRRRRE